MENKKISIIIPAYNVEKYIRVGIESCINQTYHNIEILIIDDGSTDNTFSICKEYEKKDARIHVIKKNNGGVSSARNLALKIASGAYFIFLDSDDWLEKKAVEKLVALQDEHKKCFVMCDRYWVELDKKGEYKKFYPARLLPITVVSSADAQVSVGSGKYNLQSSCYKLFDIKIIKENNISFDEKIYYGEDGLFVFTYLKHINSIVYSSEPLWDIFDRPGSATKISFNSKMLTTLDSVAKMMSFPDNSSAVNWALIKYMVRRIEDVLKCAISSNAKLFRNDILFLKLKLNEYGEIYRKNNCSVMEKFELMKYEHFPIKLILITNLIEDNIKKILKKLFFK